MGEILKAIGANIEVIHIVLFAIGVICMVIELFEPGVGVFGIAGVGVMIVDIFVLAETITQGVVLFAILSLIIMVFVILIVILASYGIIPTKLVLKDSTSNSDGYSAAKSVDIKVGDKGIAQTFLRPAGKATFDSKSLDVVSDGKFIEEGKRVVVIEINGNRIVVSTDIDG